MKTAKKKGAPRMTELGYKQVQVWLDHNEVEAIGKAKREQGIPTLPYATLLRKLACDFAGIKFASR